MGIQHFETPQLTSILEIGGGYGTLGEILLKARPDFYLNVDVPPVAAVATYYLQQVFGSDAVFTYSEARNAEQIDIDEIRTRYRAAVLAPWLLPRLKGNFDVFANFISFQEMKPHVVRNHARIVQRHTDKYVLLRNSVSGKSVSTEGSLGVLHPTTTDDMITFFDACKLVGRDSIGCGDESLDGSYRSEVLCLVRF